MSHSTRRSASRIHPEKCAIYQFLIIDWLVIGPDNHVA